MELLYAIFIAPLELLYRELFLFVASATGSFGLGLITMSVINALLFIPLSKLAMGIEGREKKIQNVLEPQIAVIKAESRGDERHQRMKNLYRRYGYHPLYSVRSAFGVLLQLPFLMAAYRMLQALPAIKGVSLLGIADISLPDGLLWGVNALPLLMTLVNIVATFTTPDFDNKAKKQAVLIALLFAVLLYAAPAALLLFWTGNNCISLIKNFLPMHGLRFRHKGNRLTRGVERFFCQGQETSLAVLASGVLILLIGVFCPAALYLSDPAFFIDGLYAMLLETLSLALAVFLPCFFLWLISPRWLRGIYVFTLLALTLLTLLFSFVITNDYGVLDVNIFAKDAALTDLHLWKRDALAYSITAVVLGGLYWCRVVTRVALPLASVAIAFVFFGAYALVSDSGRATLVTEIEVPVGEAKTPFPVPNPGKTNSSIAYFQMPYPSLYTEALPAYNDKLLRFSRTEPNVLVLLFDMFTGGHINEMLQEDPELAQALDGFTWYPDTVAIGSPSIFSIPPIYGGHTFSPNGFNSREDVGNLEKWNMAYALVSKAFLSKGFEVAYTNLYNYDPDLYAKHVGNTDNVLVVENIGSSYLAAQGGKPSEHIVGATYSTSKFVSLISLFRVMPHLLRKDLYTSGTWLGTVDNAFSNTLRFAQNETAFFASLPDAAKADNGPGTLKVMYTLLTHVPWHLLPDRLEVVADPYPETEGLYTTIDSIVPEHYFTERHVMRMMTRFFAWMRQEGVYDNTIIIMVSDHCSGDSRMLNEALGKRSKNLAEELGTEKVYPGRAHSLLMVKERGAHGSLRIVDDLMTNGEVPAFICEAIGGCDGVSPKRAFPPAEGRIREHMEGYWRFEGHPDNTYTIWNTHRINGTMFQLKNWQWDRTKPKT